MGRRQGFHILTSEGKIQTSDSVISILTFMQFKPHYEIQTHYKK